MMHRSRMLLGRSFEVVERRVHGGFILFILSQYSKCIRYL